MVGAAILLPLARGPASAKGILHGLFVFVEIASFWAHQVGRRDRKGWGTLALGGFKTAHSQLMIARDVLRANGRFTSVGKELLDDLDRRIGELQSLAETIDGDSISPLYAELHTDD